MIPYSKVVLFRWVLFISVIYSIKRTYLNVVFFYFESLERLYLILLEYFYLDVNTYGQRSTRQPEVFEQTKLYIIQAHTC